MEVLHKWNDQEIHQRSFLHHLERGGREGGGNQRYNQLQITPISLLSGI